MDLKQTAQLPIRARRADNKSAARTIQKAGQ
ncbi:hypothetical protein QE431_001966 [Flavobacterium sp. SORGH_AS 622]|nr:hypothetical protein [Flavobacterium sp. SORGH_AS_0622]